jgi:hypothetical protein
LDLWGEIAALGGVQIVVDDLRGGSGAIWKNFKLVWLHESAEREIVKVNTSDSATDSFDSFDGILRGEGDLEMDGSLES